MALTLNDAYAGAQQTQYNPQPTGFYASTQIAATDAGATIMDNEMDEDFDSLCTVIANKALTPTGSANVYDAAIHVDGTLVTVLNDCDGTQPVDVIVPKGTYLKVIMSNQTNTASTDCQAYVIIRPLQGSSSV
tara:strand:+ start:1068 stop:1466 length:399 start_codon:yes stop_codon:yes gene_type:complete